MAKAQAVPEFESLTLDQQLELVQTLWDRIAARTDPFPLTDAQRVELDRRLAEHETDPDDVIPWEQVREELRHS